METLSLVRRLLLSCPVGVCAGRQWMPTPSRLRSACCPFAGCRRDSSTASCATLEAIGCQAAGFRKVPLRARRRPGSQLRLTVCPLARQGPKRSSPRSDRRRGIKPALVEAAAERCRRVSPRSEASKVLRRTEAQARAARPRKGPSCPARGPRRPPAPACCRSGPGTGGPVVRLPHKTDPNVREAN